MPSSLWHTESFDAVFSVVSKVNRVREREGETYEVTFGWWYNIPSGPVYFPKVGVDSRVGYRSLLKSAHLLPRKFTKVGGLTGSTTTHLVSVRQGWLKMVLTSKHSFYLHQQQNLVIQKLLNNVSGSLTMSSVGISRRVKDTIGTWFVLRVWMG